MAVAGNRRFIGWLPQSSVSYHGCDWNKKKRALMDAVIGSWCHEKSKESFPRLVLSSNISQVREKPDDEAIACGKENWLS